MKRTLCAVTAFVILLSLCACGRSVPGNSVHEPGDLSGKRVGVMLGSDSASLMSAYEAAGTVTVSYYTSGNSMIDDLENGIIDCVVAEERACGNTVPDSSRVKELDTPLVKTSYRIAVAKENVALTEDINAALAVLEQNGTLKKIIDGYLYGEEYRYESTLAEDAVTGTVTLAVDAVFPPYEYYGEEGEIIGLDIDIARAVCDILGVGLEIKTVEPGTLISEVQSGKVALAMGRLSATEENLSQVDFSNPYLSVTQQIIVRKK